MKKHKIYNILITFFFSLIFLSGSAVGASLPDLVKKIRPAVVTIATYGMNGESQGLGTGFFIDPDGVVVTNHHVMKSAYSAEIKTIDNRIFPVTTIIAENESADLIKMQVNLSGTKIEWVKIDDALPEIAEQVMVVGSPMGLEQTVSSGIVSAVREVPGIGNFFQISAPISRGSSGSPVVNMKGKVIGVVSFMLLFGQNLNFAVSGENVMALEPLADQQTVSEWTFTSSLKLPSMAETLCREGLKSTMDGDYQKAVEFFEKATESDPKDPMAWYGLGHCYIGLEKPDKVIETYKQAIDANPKDPRIPYYLGNYYAKVGRNEDAIASYQESLRLNPDVAGVHDHMGVVLGKMGRFTEAILSHQQSIRIDPDDAMAHFNLGVTYERAGKLNEAIDAYEKAVRVEPQFVQAYNNLGILLSQAERGREAVAAHLQVIRSQPDFAPAHYNLGVAYLVAGNKASALEEYKILLHLDAELAAQLFNQIYR